MALFFEQGEKFPHSDTYLTKIDWQWVSDQESLFWGVEAVEIAIAHLVCCGVVAVPARSCSQV